MNQDTLKRILDGDLDAYDGVVRQYQGMLLGYAANRLASIDVAQEVVQLTFIRAYEQLNEYDPQRDFGVWLCVICKHFIWTELERQRRESRNLEKFSHALRLRLGEELARSNDSPLVDENHRDLIGSLRECLQKLPEPAASVVQLRYRDRKSCQTIADSLNRTVTWVTTSLSRSRKSLRQCIEGRLAADATA
ncbi:MAG: sigma-70 family RNA polymerase sigma factor [Planctomycetota bacterium]